MSEFLFVSFFVFGAVLLASSMIHYYFFVLPGTLLFIALEAML